MKTSHAPIRSKSGSAIVTAMILTMITAGTIVGVLSYASHSIELTQRSIDFQRARTAAEAGIDYGRSKLLEILQQLNGQILLQQKPKCHLDRTSLSQFHLLLSKNFFQEV